MRYTYLKGELHPKKALNVQTQNSKTKSCSRHSPAKNSQKATSSKLNCYRYVVKVEETVEYSTAIESNKKMTWEELEKIAEQRRVKGQLSFLGVTNVNSWCSSVHKKPGKGNCKVWSDT